MNMCRETFPQLLSFYPGNALLTADGRGRGGEERDGGERETPFICNMEFKFGSTGKA